MKNGKQILHRLLFPGIGVTLPAVPLSAGLLIYAFGFAGENDPLAYAAYVVSFYMLVLLCVRIPGLVRGISALLHRSRYLHRYLTDLPFRTRVSLYLSLGINLLYAVLKLFLGVRFRSVWFGTLGVYYALLTAMRFLLLCHTRRSAFGAQLIPEWKRYRLCGAILIPMTVALAGVVILMLENRESFQYPGYLIYVAAMYAFYASISAAVRLVRYRQYQSPVMTAAKAISLVSALVSMLSLEAAMLTQFGGRDDEAFRQIMLAATGAGVCSIILVMAAYMLIHGARQLGKLPAGR